MLTLEGVCIWSFTDKMMREMPVERMIHHLFSKIKLHTSLENFTSSSNFALTAQLLPSLDFLLPAAWNLYPRPPLSSTILKTFHATRFCSCYKVVLLLTIFLKAITPSWSLMESLQREFVFRFQKDFATAESVLSIWWCIETEVVLLLTFCRS